MCLVFSFFSSVCINDFLAVVTYEVPAVLNNCCTTWIKELDISKTFNRNGNQCWVFLSLYC